MRIALVSDAWRPQVNGVVRTLSAVVDIARGRGHRVDMITPDRFRSVAMPNYPEIRLALATPRAVGAMIDDTAADAVHIATEGPLGWAARRRDCAAIGPRFRWETSCDQSLAALVPVAADRHVDAA